MYERYSKGKGRLLIKKLACERRLLLIDSTTHILKVLNTVCNDVPAS